mmetsp:Transcript_17523/g.48737  ORF Transcript_17523/g.48737 Transcript_17523/m.48737 type:complete len:393 (-) Transcript_17523:6480-7658(-)
MADILLTDALNDRRGHIVLVIGLQGLDKIWVSKNFLSAGPEVVNHLARPTWVLEACGPHIQQHTNSFHHQLDGAWGTFEALHELDVRSFDGVQSRQGCLQDGEGLCQGILTLLFDGIGCVCCLFCLLHIYIHNSFLGLHDLSLFLLDRGHEALCLCHSVDELGLEVCQLILHDDNLLLCEQQLLQADLIAPLGCHDLCSFGTQQCCEGVQELQVRGGGHVIDAACLLPVLLAQVPHIHVECAADGDNAAALLIAHIWQAIQLFLCHSHKSILRPLWKPVDCTAIDQRRKLAQPLPEGIAHGRHAQHHMQVLPRRVQKVIPDLHRSLKFQPFLLALLAACFHECLAFLIGKYVGDLSRVEEVVDVHQEGLVLDLGVAEEEHCGLAQFPGVALN